MPTAADVEDECLYNKYENKQKLVEARSITSNMQTITAMDEAFMLVTSETRQLRNIVSACEYSAGRIVKGQLQKPTFSFTWVFSLALYIHDDILSRFMLELFVDDAPVNHFFKNVRLVGYSSVVIIGAI